MTTKFIKLTESMTGGDKKVLLLNTAYISHVQAGSNGKDTHIKMCHQNSDGKNHYYFVSESASEVWNLINGAG